MTAIFGVIDLFAGPGGLGEGFASLELRGRKPYKVVTSIEKEISAYQTLSLRAFLREYRARHDRLPKEFIKFHAGIGSAPRWEDLDTAAWNVAKKEAHCLELGTVDASHVIDNAIKELARKSDETVLIGGPPCQAYSLVGRARARGTRGYVPENDHRHYLFREYIRVLSRLRPAAFVMENVKGILSSTVDSRLIFEMLMEDLSSLGGKKGHQYTLHAIVVENGGAILREVRSPSDFIVRSEEFGVPQKRHRVIIVGLRSDLSSGAKFARIALQEARRTSHDVIGNLPALRSGISRGRDGVEEWRRAIINSANSLAKAHRGKAKESFHEQFLNIAQTIKIQKLPPRACSSLPARYARGKDDLLQWIENNELQSIAQHETRGHMVSDLSRYLYASVFGQLNEFSPKAFDFPDIISPEHRNWNSGIFSDRFRVQLWNEPASTITSHISKDGHYFIHPDPYQCRSLTVREAARLQTFPDDYLFLGNRTQQYVQVGNAVPPYLAKKIAALVYKAITK